MKRKIATLVVILVVLITFLLVRYSVFNDKIEKVCFSKCFNVEIADNKAERNEGLMNRQSLEDDSGMLFVFEEEGEYSFWMKDTEIALDIIWLSDELKVVEIVRAEPCNNEPCQLYGGNEKARYVLEINAGQVETSAIELGKTARFE